MVSFQTAVLALAVVGSSPAQGETVLLDFCADWCTPCRQMDPVVQELAARGYPVRKVNVDHEPALAAKYGVGPVPCFVMLVDGQVVDRVVGGTTFSRLERMCTLGQSGGPASQSPLPQATPLPQPTRPPQPTPLPQPTQPLPQPTPPLRQPTPPQPWAASPQSWAASPEPGRAPVTLPDIQRIPAFSNPEQPASGPANSQASGCASLAGWRLADPSRSPGVGVDESTIERLIAATVRLRIEDPDGHSCGSGTIIDARDGKALILTCGHIFRDSKGKGRIEVDLFGPAPAERIPGYLLAYDLERDIGLLWIAAPGPVATARVAPPGYRIARDDRVLTVGCNNGEPPSVRHSRITSVDKFLGPPNLQVAGLPVQGRSGGGLFSREGFVIGVCNAADPDCDEGLYTALAAVHAELDEADLAFVSLGTGGGLPAQAPLVAVDPPAMPRQMPRPSTLVPVSDGATPLSDTATDRQPTDRLSQLTGEEQAALEEIQRRKEEGAEVVCVIRSRSDPQAPSEIIVLDRVSRAFLERLAAQSETEEAHGRRLTSLAIPSGVQGADGAGGVPSRQSVSARTLLEYRSGVPSTAAASDVVPSPLYGGGRGSVR